MNSVGVYAIAITMVTCLERLLLQRQALRAWEKVRDDPGRIAGLIALIEARHPLSARLSNKDRPPPPRFRRRRQRQPRLSRTAQ